MEELKPCPFCGGEAIPPNELDHHVSCSECRASGGNWAEYDSAVEAWNTRHERTCLNVTEQGTEDVCYKCDLFKCSSCGWDGIVDDGLVKRTIAMFCPNCGAKVLNDD